nr:unnamed protein product [Callosobruchus chinensis]
MQQVKLLVQVAAALLVVRSTKAQDEISVTTLKAPIFPYHVGNAKIPQNFHTFIHYIDTHPLVQQLSNIQSSYKQLADILNFSESDTSNNHISLSGSLTHTKILITEASRKLNNIIPHSRQKRGLLNIIGTSSKFLFGTMDADDEQKINNAIYELQTTENSVQNQLKMQVSLTKELIDNYKSTIALLSSNQRLIKSKLYILENSINKTLGSVTNYLKAEHVWQQIILNCQNFITFLDNLENAIMFTKLNTLHSTVISESELESNVKHMIKLYGSKKVPEFKNFNSFYLIADTKVIFSYQKIIFSIRFPIFHDETFQLFRLYPIPIKHSTILPSHPYLALGTSRQQYEDEECPMIEDIYICKDHLEPIQGCFYKLLKEAEFSTCQFTLLTVLEPIIEAVSENRILIIPAEKPIKVIKICRQEEPLLIETPSLIQLPEDCGIQINTSKFWNKKEVEKGNPWFLPEIKFWESKINFTANAALKLNTIDLKKIEKIQEKANLLELQAQAVHPLVWSSGSSVVTILLLMLVAVIIWVVWKKKNQAKKTENKKREEKKEDSTENKNVPFLFSS